MMDIEEFHIKGIENIFNKVRKIFLNEGKKMPTQVQEVYIISNI